MAKVAKKKEVRKPLIAASNGAYRVSNEKEAIQAISQMQRLEEEIQKFEEKHGIAEMRRNATELKKAAQRFCVESGVDVLNLPDGSYGRVITQGHNRRWILRTEDVPDGATGAKSLRAILAKKLGKGTEDFKEAWKRATKMVADPDGIEELVNDGIVSPNEIAPAYVEETKAPYLRIFGSNDA